MTDSHAMKQERWRGTFALAGYGALYFLAALLPDRRLWGINHLAFLPGSARILFVIALAVAIAAIWRWRGHSPFRPPRISAGAIVATAVIGWLVLTWLARSSTQLLGDGYLRADEVERLKPGAFGITEFLPGLLASTIQQNFLNGFGFSGRDTLALLGVIAGVVLFLGALLLWPRVVGNDSQRVRGRSLPPLSALWLLAAGSSALFFGYTESYALSWALLSLFTLALLAHRRGHLGWGWLVALWVAAVWSHLAALAWAPALIMETSRRKSPGRSGYLAPVVSVLAIVACVVVLWTIKPSRDHLSLGSHILPIWGSGYSVFDWRHWADVVNELLLLAPVALLLLWPGDNDKRWRVSPDNVLLFGPIVVAFVLFNPELSFSRDWDLFALFSAPALTVLAVAIAGRQNSWSAPRRIAAITIAVTSAGLWLWLNANATASAVRFGALLQLDSHSAMVGTGRENLARHWREQGRWDLVADELGRALAVGPHARLATQRSIAFSAMQMPDSALVSFQAAVAADSTDPDGFFGTGQMLWVLGRAAESLPYLERAVAMDSTRADYRYHLGMALRDLGRPGDARPHLEFAALRNPGQPDYATAYSVTLYDLGDYEGAVTTISSIIQRHPEYTLAHLNLAWVFYKMGRLDDAARALSDYEQRQPPDAMDPGPHRLRSLLDSAAAANPRPQ